MANDVVAYPPHAPLNLVWDEAIMDVLENGNSVKRACESRGLKKGSYYYELEKRDMHTRKPRVKKAEKVKAMKTGPKRAAMKTPQQWDSIFAMFKNEGKSIDFLCAKFNVTRAAFQAALSRREKKSQKTAAPVARAIPMMGVAGGQAAEIDRLRAKVHELAGENKAYKAMLRMFPARRR